MGGKGGSPSPPLLAKGAGPRLRVRARPAQATPRGPGSRCQRGGERACPKGCTRGRRGQESGAPVCGVGGGRQAFESAACNWQLVTSGRRCVLVWGGRAQRDDGRRAGAGGRVRESRSAADPAAAPRGRPKQTAKSATGARERRCAGKRGGGGCQGGRAECCGPVAECGRDGAGRWDRGGAAGRLYKIGGPRPTPGRAAPGAAPALVRRWPC